MYRNFEKILQKTIKLKEFAKFLTIFTINLQYYLRNLTKIRTIIFFN